MRPLRLGLVACLVRPTPDPVPVLHEPEERGDAGVAAGVSCPDNLIPKFLDLGVQYFHSNVESLLQNAGQNYLKTVRQAAASLK